MDITNYLDVIAEQRRIVLDLEDLEATLLAKNIAFYAAMLDAAEDEPLDDPELQEMLVDVMKKTYKGIVEEYQRRINRLI